MKRWIGIAFSVSLVAVLVYAVSRPATQSVHAAKAETGAVAEFVDERATTKLPRIYRIKMPFGGYIEEVQLEVGDSIEVNDVLVQVLERTWRMR